MGESSTFELEPAAKRFRKRRSDALKPDKVRSQSINCRATKEYKDFFTQYCKDQKKTQAEVLDEAIAAHVRQARYHKAPPPMSYLPMPKPGKPANEGSPTRLIPR